MPRAVSPTTPVPAAAPQRSPWRAPILSELPKLTALTLASAIGGGGGTGGGGSTVFGILLALLALTGCSAEREIGEDAEPGMPNAVSQLISCTVQREALTLTCAAPAATPGQGVLGGQGISVGLRSSALQYDAGTSTLSAAVSVQNLTSGPIGTQDGTTLSSGVSVFFVNGPTAAPTGSVTVTNATGTGTFTSSGQTYYNYPSVLAAAEISDTIRWRFQFAGGATSFTFEVLVAADQPAPGSIGRWNAVPGFGSPQWMGISGFGADGLVLFGTNGDRFVREGGVWRSISDPLLDQSHGGLPKVFATSGANIGAFTYDNLAGIYRLRLWDGSGYQTLEGMPNAPSPFALTIASAGGIDYVAGDSLWKWSNGAWAADTAPTLASGIASAATINGQLVVMGSNTGVWLYTGSQYRRIGTGVTGLTDGEVVLFGPDTTHLWATTGANTDPSIKYYNGTGWTTQTPPLSASTDLVYPRSATSTSATSAYIGANRGYGDEGFIYRWDGSAWSLERSSQAIGGVWARNDNEVYAAWQNGIVEKRDGTGSWSTVLPIYASRIVGVWMLSSTDGYMASSSGHLFRYNGTSWADVGVVRTSAHHSIWASGPNAVWSARSSTDLDYFDGTTTTPVLTGVGYWKGVGGSAANDVWAVGQLGKIIHYDGSTWSQSRGFCAPTCDDWNAVYAKDPAFAVVVGATGWIGMWNGTSWSYPSISTGADFNAVHGSSRNNVWAVGNGGVTYRWDGTTWSPHSSCTSNTLTGVYTRGPNEVYVVGDYGTLCQWNGTSWSHPSSNGAIASAFFDAMHGAGSTAVAAGTKVFVGRR